MSPPKKSHRSDGPILREHEYDGIQEFDQRLPNWWLLTLFGAMVFSFGYWFHYFQGNLGQTPEQQLASRLAVIETIKLSSGMANLDNPALWKMSRNPTFVNAGRETFMSTCVACHGANLQGGIGVNLVDNTFVHGPTPMDHLNTVKNGVAAKGMPTWGPVLGDKKIAEVVSFIMSHHTPPSGP
jgi:cytochrome c oxidase cbb3-type subunit 3